MQADIDRRSVVDRQHAAGVGKGDDGNIQQVDNVADAARRCGPAGWRRPELRQDISHSAPMVEDETSHPTGHIWHVNLPYRL
jgi:hypothetical protein